MNSADNIFYLTMGIIHDDDIILDWGEDSLNLIKV